MMATTDSTTRCPRRAKVCDRRVPCVGVRGARALPLEVRHEAARPGEADDLERHACLDRLARLRERLASLIRAVR